MILHTFTTCVPLSHLSGIPQAPTPRRHTLGFCLGSQRCPHAFVLLCPLRPGPAVFFHPRQRRPSRAVESRLPCRSVPGRKEPCALWLRPACLPSSHAFLPQGPADPLSVKPYLILGVSPVQYNLSICQFFFLMPIIMKRGKTNNRKSTQF